MPALVALIERPKEGLPGGPATPVPQEEAEGEESSIPKEEGEGEKTKKQRTK